jgi:hypothetical protein
LNEYGKKYEFTDYLPNSGALVTEADDFGLTTMFFKVYGKRNGAHYRVKRLFAVVGCGIVKIGV